MALVEAEGVARYAPPVETEIDLVLLGISMLHLVRPLDMQYVSELAETDEKVWEPIEVRIWPTEWKKPDPQVVYHVVSGNHRTSAARKKDLRTIRARIIEAPDELSYLDAAVRTNSRHGRNFTNEDRRDLAFKYKKLGLTTAEIADRFSVHRSTVKNWFSGRDSNASKKRQSEQKADAMRLLAQAEADMVDEDWSTLPDVSVDEKLLVQTRTDIIDFLRTPVVLDKAHVVKLIHSLELEDSESLLSDMRTVQRWLLNVISLLDVKKRGMNEG